MTGWCGGGGAGEARRCRVLWMKVLWFFLSRKNVFAATWLRFLSVWASEKRGSFAPLKMTGGGGMAGRRLSLGGTRDAVQSLVHGLGVAGDCLEVSLGGLVQLQLQRWKTNTWERFGAIIGA